MKKQVLVLLSGGLDSATLAKHYLNKGWDVQALFVDYGQPWYREMDSARKVAEYLKIPLESYLGARLSVDSKFFVPVRNAHLLTIAVHHAYLDNIPNVAFGSNRGEFLDQTAEFIDRFNFMLDYCFKGQRPWVLAPFCPWPKERIFKYAMKLGIPIELTRSCMGTVLDRESLCGICTSCKLRIKYGYLDLELLRAGYHEGVGYEKTY